MNLDRPTRTPKFVEYAVNYALNSQDTELPSNVADFDPNPIEIPPYQRKIVWDEKTITDFLDSKAVLFGTVILAQLPTKDQLVLLDGLQRFATSTAILNYLHSEILPNITNSEIKAGFNRLVADTESKKVIFEHNDMHLRNNTRIGIQKSYAELYNNMTTVIDDLNKKNPTELAKKLTETFVKKQIAIDTYHGFRNSGECIQTFININSAGMDLNQVDLLRSEIIQQAETLNWSLSDIDEVENKFTEVFQPNKNDFTTATKVLGKHLYDGLIDNPRLIFQQWEGLNKEHVDDLLDFIKKTYEASNMLNQDGHRMWPYLHENFQCGDIPFAIIIWFYYKKSQSNGELPDFLGGKLDTTSDLRTLLRSFYRRIISSSMNRADVVASKLIEGKNSNMLKNMRFVADEINPADQSLDEFVDLDWLKSNMKKSNAGKIKRVFNACLLPKQNLKGNFQPMHYGSDDDGWVIDYLITKSPKSKNSINDEHFNSLVNKFPLPYKLKKKLKNATCLEKITSDELMKEMKNKHPYLTWLIEDHAKLYKEKTLEGTSDEFLLNSIQCLSDEADPPVGKERLEKIIELLHERI